METLETLAERYLVRGLRQSDGSTLSAIERAERRLGCPLPQSIRDYYAKCGRNRRFNKSHHVVRGLREVAIEQGYLIVMDENQDVVSWGIPLANIADVDPILWQRNNTPPVAWHSEEKTWSELLASMFAWYAEAGIWRQPRHQPRR